MNHGQYGVYSEYTPTSHGIYTTYTHIIHNVNQKWAVWGLTAGKSSVSVIYCLLVEFNGQKGAYYASQFVQGNKFGTILLAL